MAGLFYDIQSMFKATYSGRYIAFLLAELFKRSPEDFSAALNAAGIAYKFKKSDNVVANRWPFPAKKKLRFADLAVLNSAGDPLVLVEIKDADIKSDTNAAQIDDYLQFLEKRANGSVQFLFLSRTVPPEDAESKLRAASHKHHVRSMLFSRL